MLYGKYQFIIELENDALMPSYKGSTFRGVFGRALKRVVCALKRQECEQCLLKERCVYALVFETPLAVKEQTSARISSPPHPFVIEPPQSEETRFQKGTMLDCHLILFGEMNHRLPYFVYAFDQMGKIGIGRRIGGERGQFALREVRSDGVLLYSHEDQKLKQGGSFEDLSFPDPASHPRAGKTIVRRGEKIPLRPGLSGKSSSEKTRIRVTMETPLRLKFENRLKAELPFHVLVRAMLRRVSSLFEVYGNGEPALDYKGLTERANCVQMVENDLSWFDWRRYSFRQDSEMLMGGMLGSAVYEGDLTEFLPLLDISSKVHIGKQTSFGMGKIRAEAAGPFSSSPHDRADKGKGKQQQAS